MTYDPTRFILARLHLVSLWDKVTKAQIIRTLNNLSRGPEALEEAYKEAFKRIDDQPLGLKTLAKSVLSWLSYARRPMTVPELCHALAVEVGDKELDPNNVPDIGDITSVCAGLVTIDEESQIVRLVHYTAQEYLETTREKWNPEAQYNIAATCLTYLCFESFQSGLCTDYKEFSTRLKQNPFLRYAATYWGDHIATVQQETLELAMCLLQKKPLIESVQQIRPSDMHGRSFQLRHARDWTGLHQTASLGLLSLSKELLHVAGGDMMYLNSKNSDGRTALLLAVRGGHEMVVDLLLGTGHVDVNGEDDVGDTPLRWAVARGYASIVKLLLDTDKIDVNNQNKNSQKTALIEAASGGHKDVVELLLKISKIDVNKPDSEGNTALILAACQGHKDVVKLLLDTDKTDVNIQDYLGHTALMVAVWHRKEGVLKLLLDHDKVDVNTRADFGTTVLIASACGGGEIVRLLLDTCKVDVNAKDKDGTTALIQAVCSSNAEVVRMLLDVEGIDVNAKDEDGNTALTMAISCGEGRVVQTLLAVEWIVVEYDELMEKALQDAVEIWGYTDMVDLVKGYTANHEATTQDVAILSNTI